MNACGQASWRRTMLATYDDVAATRGGTFCEHHTKRVGRQGRSGVRCGPWRTRPGSHRRPSRPRICTLASPSALDQASRPCPTYRCTLLAHAGMSALNTAQRVPRTSNQTRRHLLHHSERCRQPARRKAPPADPYLDARLASSGSCRAASVNVRHKEARANDVVDVRRRYTTAIS